MTRNEPSRDGDWNVSPYNFDPAVRENMNLPEQVEVVDLSLREGRQVAGVALTLDEVLEYATRSAQAGFTTLEMHHQEPEEIRQVTSLGLGIKVQSLVHPTASLNPDNCRREIDESLEVGAEIICLSAVVSDYNHSLLEELGGVSVTREEHMDAICEMVRHGKEQGGTISVLLADHTRLDVDLLCRFTAQIAEAGADIVRMDDICAPAMPAVYTHHAKRVKQSIGDCRLAIHSHNDFDLAVAAQLASMEGGADILEGSVNGYGERAGIPDLAVLVANLELLYGYDTGIDMSQMKGLSEWVATTWGKPVPDAAAVVGRKAFSHAVGVHYVENHWAFNAWMPHVVGSDDYVPLCMFSGPKASVKKARDLGVANLTPEQADVVNTHVRAELLATREEISDDRFKALVAEALA